MVENQFNWLCDVLGKRVASNYKDVGAWCLDYQPTYGGYSIKEINEHGEFLPFGQGRYSASKMFDMIQFALRSIALDRNNGDLKNGSYWPSDKTTNVA